MAESWVVVGQRQTSILSPNGGFEDAMQVTFKTAKGITANITVPKSQFTPQNVHGLIEADAAQIDAVHELSGDQASSVPPPSVS